MRADGSRAMWPALLREEWTCSPVLTAEDRVVSGRGPALCFPEARLNQTLGLREHTALSPLPV